MAAPLRLAKRWYETTSDVTLLSSPWVGYQTGYAFRWMWLLLLVGLQIIWSDPSVYEAQHASLLSFVAMWYCWAATTWYLLASPHWQGITATLLFALGVSLSLDAYSVNEFGPLGDHFSGRASVNPTDLTVPVIVSHCNVHPLSLLLSVALKDLHFVLDMLLAEDNALPRPFEGPAEISQMAIQCLLCYSFTRTFTMRVAEVASGLSVSSEGRLTLMGRSSRGCSWIIGLVCWMQCFAVSACRIARTDSRFEYLYHEAVLPKMAWVAPLAAVAALFTWCRNVRSWQADLALATVSCLPQVWLWSESQLLEAEAPRPRSLYFYDVQLELWQIAQFQNLISTQSLILAGSQPLIAWFFGLALVLLRGAYQFVKAEWLGHALFVFLLITILTNHTVDFYLRTSALRDLVEDPPEVEMGAATDA